VSRSPPAPPGRQGMPPPLHYTPTYSTQCFSLSLCFSLFDLHSGVSECCSSCQHHHTERERHLHSITHPIYSLLCVCVCVCVCVCACIHALVRGLTLRCLRVSRSPRAPPRRQGTPPPLHYTPRSHAGPTPNWQSQNPASCCPTRPSRSPRKRSRRLCASAARESRTRCCCRHRRRQGRLRRWRCRWRCRGRREAGSSRGLSSSPAGG
jgi:hypothetical protein